MRTALAIAVGLVLAVVGAIPASAAPGEPPFDPGDEWTLTGSTEDSSTISVECDTASEWAWAADDQSLTLQTVPCLSSQSASGMYEWLAIPGAVVPGASAEGELVLWDGERVTRSWIAPDRGDLRLLAVLTVTCAGASRDICVDGSAELALDAMAALPGGLSGVDTPGLTIQSWVIWLIVPVLFIGVVVVPVRLIRSLIRPRYISASTSPRYADVTGRVRGARWRRRVRRFLWWTLAFVGMIGVSGITTRDGSIGLGAGAMALILLGLVLLGRYTVLKPDPVERGRRAVTGLGAQAVVGTVLSALAYILAALLILVLALLVNYGASSDGWPTLTAADIERMGLPLLPALSPWVTALGSDAFLVGMLAAVPALIGVALLDGFGQRLRNASIDEALAQDNRPHYLYLRSFDEDRLTLTGQLRRRGLISALSLVRRVRFEEVLVRQLSTTGPVIAIAPPGSNLPAIGAARASFSNDEWQHHVTRYAQTARAVVLSATPGEIRQGYGWELDLVANRIGHQRVMVVLGPWPLNQLRRRWTQFCHAVAHVPFFGPITMPWVPDGVHVLAHSPRLGWQGYGATRRLDWTYAVAIDAATRAYLPEWS